MDTHTHTDDTQPFLLVLGIAQDAGYPQAGCRGPCCAPAWHEPARRRHAACVAVVDPRSGARWMVDATPDFKHQLRALDAAAPTDAPPGLTGILLTHGHMGHVAGLMYLGREAMGAPGTPVYAMPRLADHLRRNGPWMRVIDDGHMTLRPLEDGVPVPLGDHLSATPVTVPHRDEVGETVGFRIAGPRRTVLHVPDIDRWETWDRRLETVLAEVDVAYVDGTFFDDDELPGRDMAEIPHPTIASTMERLRPLPEDLRSRVRFIHLNHTNPALDPTGEAARAVAAAGFRLAAEGERVGL